MADYGIKDGVASYWVNRDGRMTISSMGTTHLINTVAFVEKRLANQALPVEYEAEAEAVLAGLRGELHRRADEESRPVPKPPQTVWERLLEDG